MCCGLSVKINTREMLHGTRRLWDSLFPRVWLANTWIPPIGAPWLIIAITWGSLVLGSLSDLQPVYIYPMCMPMCYFKVVQTILCEFMPWWKHMNYNSGRPLFLRRESYHSPSPGADLEGRALFFVEIGRLTLCGRPKQNECTKSCKLTLKITIFSTSEGAHPHQTPPVPTGTKVLSVLNFGTPSFKKSWIRPCSLSLTAS